LPFPEVLKARPAVSLLDSRFLITACLLVVGTTTGLLHGPGRVLPDRPRATGSWLKGNLHAHTSRSDGDSTPDEVARWYRNHDYDFLVLSDHGALSPAEALNTTYGADHQFLVIQGEEVSDDAGPRPIHLNALGVSEKVDAQHGATVLESLQLNVDAVRLAGGVPQVNHPNYRSAITGEDLRLLEHDRLFEIFNGHPQANNFGSDGVPGLEEVWDRILSSGKVMYGVADDDAHVFKWSLGSRASRPGRGWVYAHAERLEARSILDALERGDFYSSTGVELRNYQVTNTGISIDVREQAASIYRVQFIGANGRVLENVTSPCASYTFSPDDSYVRVRVQDSTGALAWTQPVFPHALHN
jgi:hypothetical protein